MNDLLATPSWQAGRVRLADHIEIVALSSSRKRVSAGDRKSTRLNSSHLVISYAVFCLKKKKQDTLVSALLRINRIHLFVPNQPVLDSCVSFYNRRASSINDSRRFPYASIAYTLLTLSF